MKIWLLENGERTGPHESFSVRERVANGELNADTPAWYDGADDWVTLADVPTMTSAFPRVEDEIIENYNDLVEEPVLDYKHELEVPEHLIQPPRLHPVRRLCARMIDIMLFMVLVSFIKVQQGLNPYDPQTPTQQFFYNIPYVLIDALMMHLMGTTLGKFLLRIKVTSATGQRLTFGKSLLRSARVWVIGLGMFIITPISLAIAWFLSKRYNKFLWDLPQNFQVEVKPVSPVRIVITVSVVLLISVMFSIVVPEEMQPKGSLLEIWKDISTR